MKQKETFYKLIWDFDYKLIWDFDYKLIWDFDDKLIWDLKLCIMYNYLGLVWAGVK